MQRTARDLALCKQRAVHSKAQVAPAATAGPNEKNSVPPLDTSGNSEKVRAGAFECKSFLIGFVDPTQWARGIVQETPQYGERDKHKTKIPNAKQVKVGCVPSHPGENRVHRRHAREGHNGVSIWNVGATKEARQQVEKVQRPHGATVGQTNQQGLGTSLQAPLHHDSLGIPPVGPSTKRLTRFHPVQKIQQAAERRVEANVGGTSTS